jgi:hypothetical protein
MFKGHSRARVKTKAMRLGDMSKVALLLALAAAPVVAVAAADEPPSDMQRLLQDCDAHKFETTIHVTGEDGQPRDSDVKVCGKPGQSDADWIRGLKDILNKTATSQDMPQAVKDQVITALNAEIVRLTALLPKEAPAVASLPPPRAAPKDDLAGDYSSLPPLPPPVREPATVAGAPVPLPETPVVAAPAPEPEASVVAAPAAGIASVPMPAAPPPVPAVAVAAAPRLTLRCVAGRDISLAAPCDPIERGNLLVLEAQQTVDSGVLLKFYRRGEPRGELRLPPMRAGQPVMTGLPDGLCSGVVRTRIEIHASGGGNSAETILGPYDLRC